MPFSSRTKQITITAGVLVLLTVSLFLAIIPVLLERWINNYDLRSAFHKATGGTISTGALKLRVFPAPHLIIPTGYLDLPELVKGSWREIKIHPAFKSILSGQIRFHKIRIIAPDVELRVSLPAEVEAQPPLEMGHLTAEHLHQILMAASHKMGGGMQWLVKHAPEARVRVRAGRLHLPEKTIASALSFHDIDAQLTLPPDTLHLELDCKSSMLRALRVAGDVDADTLTGQLTLWFNSLDAKALANITGLDRSLDRVDGMLSGHMTVDLKGPSQIESHISFRLPQLLLQRLETPVTIQNAFVDGTAIFNESSFRFDLARLYAQQPRLSLTGHVQVGGDYSGLRVHLVGSRINIAEARQATLALAGDSQRTVAIFDVLRAGNVPWISWRTEGERIGDLNVFRNMKLTGEVQDGELYIPAADLKLTDVNGVADIVDGVLRGESLSARDVTATGRDGKLWIDFEPDDIPFFLQIDTHLQDAGHLPPRLLQWVTNSNLQRELKRLHEVRGEARGVLVLDSRKGAGLEVTADVAQCRLALRYDRLPWEINIDKGLVLYTNDQIALDQMSGRIGASTFDDLKARVDFGGETWLRIDAVRASFDLEAVIPWLMSFEALDAVVRPYRVAGGTAEIDRLNLQGPFFSASRWAFTTEGRIDRLAVDADHLPGPLNFSNLQIKADEHSLNVANTDLKVLDAAVTGSARAAFTTGRLDAFGTEFKGTLGHRADKWINDLFEEDADLFLTKAPLAVAEAKLDWARGKPFVTFADFKTPQGVRVLLSSEWQPQVFRKHRVRIVDGDLQAIVSHQQRSDRLALTFEGTLTGKTLGRLLLRNPFPSGRLRGDFQVDIDRNRPDRSTANGNLTAANIRLPLKTDRKIHISQLQLTADDNRLKIAPAAFLVDESWHTLEGTIRLASRRYHLDLQHEGAFFSLPATEETQSPKSQEQIEWLLNLPVEGKIQSRLSALKWGEQRWVPLQFTSVVSPGNWQVDIEEAGLCGIQTTGTVVLASDKIAVDLKHDAQDKPLNAAMSCLLGKPDLIDGRFRLEGRLAGTAPSLEDLGPALEGEFQFDAEDGRIYRFDLLGRILATINLTELVRGKKSDLMGEGLAYREIEVKAQLKNNQLTLEEAVIDGASAEIAAKGSLDLGADEIDLLVLVAPLKTVDAIVKFTPIINTWLEGTLISIPVKVAGAIEDPSITPLAPSAVGSSLLNLLKNTIQLPIKLVEPLIDNEDEKDEAPPPP